jgi:hypothetical protein
MFCGIWDSVSSEAESCVRWRLTSRSTMRYFLSFDELEGVGVAAELEGMWLMDLYHRRADTDALSSILTVLVSDQAPALLGFDETIDQFCKDERKQWFDNKFYPQVSTTTSPTPPNLVLA